MRRSAVQWIRYKPQYCRLTLALTKYYASDVRPVIEVAVDGGWISASDRPLACCVLILVAGALEDEIAHFKVSWYLL